MYWPSAFGRHGSCFWPKGKWHPSEGEDDGVDVGVLTEKEDGVGSAEVFVMDDNVGEFGELVTLAR